jgi:pentapeptide MXKDX repeat protein
MSRWIRSFAGIVVVTGLGFAIAGCSNTSSPAKADKMSGDKMGDKMAGDKMGGDKMKDKPGG